MGECGVIAAYSPDEWAATCYHPLAVVAIVVVIYACRMFSTAILADGRDLANEGKDEAKSSEKFHFDVIK
jgi:hypothetical protein